MTGRATAWSLVVALALAGCGAQSKPGTATVMLGIAAQPKAGVKEHVHRVAVYDAAPAPPAPAGQYEHVDYASLGNVIVWLEPAPKQAGFPPALSLDIDLRTAPPAVHPASVGQTIAFRNRGGGAVSLYSVSDDNDFTLPALPPGGQGSCVIRSPGLIEVLADPSRPPVALIYAAPSPWVAASRAGKTVVFNDVPPGSYEAQSWHPRLPGASAKLTLAPDQVTRSTLVIGVKNLAPAQK
jgi:hypothetical protein